MATTKPYKVSQYDGEAANGAVGILAMLLEQNFEKFPSRVKIARRMPRPVAVVSKDTGDIATMVFGTDEALVYNGTVGRPSVTVHATLEQILDVSQLPMKAGGMLPVGFFTKRGLRVLGNILAHKLVVKGLLTHTIASLQFIALVSIAE